MRASRIMTPVLPAKGRDSREPILDTLAEIDDLMHRIATGWESQIGGEQQATAH